MKQGYFDDAKREFVITDMKPRRRLNNFLWNEEMVCACDHFGSGNSWGDLKDDRRTLEAGDRNLYIKDKKTGVYYSANRNYNDLPFDVFETHVGLGYHTVVSEYQGLRTEFTILAPVEGIATLFQIKVKNIGNAEREIGTYFTILPRPSLTAHAAYGYAEKDSHLNGLIYMHKGFNVNSEYTTLFVGSEKAFDEYDTSCKTFRGEYNGFHNPIGLENASLANRGTTFEGEHIAAFGFNISLKAGEEFENTFFIAWEKDSQDILKDRNRYLGKDKFTYHLSMQKQLNETYLDTFTLNSPDNYLNSQTNIWLKRQVSLGKTWGRLYGKGYRDVMQDITAFASFDIELARKRILYALQYQYEDGNPIRMFEPNFRYPYNDGGAWITGAVLSYIYESGDLSIFEEQVTYLKGDSYESVSYADAFVSEPYTAGKRKDSVFEHVKSAIDYLLNCRGERNLVLWRGGDWNDSLNNVGVLNKGESVWLSIATVKAVNEWQEILKILNKQEEISLYEEKKQALIKAIQTYGMKNGVYKYGINDYGEDVGGEDRMFLNPQTWSVLANIGDKAEQERIMDEVESRLKCAFGYVQCAPSYTQGSDKIGRVSYFQKGLVENGAVYNHGVAFKIVADCMLGRGEHAYETFKLISCDNPNNLDSGVEPYAVSNMYIGPENEYSAGYAPMSWITGTAGWLYRSVTEFICGVKPTMNGLKIQPCMPASWDGVCVTRKYRGETYNIRYEKAEENALICDGKEVEILPLTEAGNEHIVVCKYKN